MTSVCKCNGGLEEIAKTQYTKTPSTIGIKIRQTIYAQCTECTRVYKKYKLPEAATVYMQYNGPLTAEEIKLNAPRTAGSFSAYDISEIIKKR